LRARITGPPPVGALRKVRPLNRQRSESWGKKPASGQKMPVLRFVLQLPDGEHVMADERFFLISAKEGSLSRADGLPRKRRSWST
jgi:hypothetical protein